MTAFEGFSRDFPGFFRELEANNNREWFNENKARYHATVVTPMLGFIEAMAPHLATIAPCYRAIAKAHGGSMFRIYRDTRFSKDKTPYKTHAACHFRHQAGKDAHAPGFYAHFEPGRVMFGGGIWRPASAQLNAVRSFIADNPVAWTRIRNAGDVTEYGGIRGESLKRVPRGFDPEHPHVEDLKRKSFYLMAEHEAALLYTPGLVDQATSAFRAAARINRFICGALELPYDRAS
jgi:uncharacterized protein (TIGR02453 family)